MLHRLPTVLANQCCILTSPPIRVCAPLRRSTAVELGYHELQAHARFPSAIEAGHRVHQNLMADHLLGIRP
eukprot:2974216-Pleurochrysis_carterae.AAC.1